MKLIDITGKRYGLLTVVGQGERTKTGSVRWICECDCGGESLSHQYNLKSGHTRSCGCLHFRAKRKGNRDDAMLRVEFTKLRSRSLSYKRGEPVIKLKHFKNIALSDCYYCKKPPSRVCEDKNSKGVVTDSTIKVNGVDRYDNNIGYLKENCVPCCTSCNSRKRINTPSEYKKRSGLCFDLIDEPGLLYEEKIINNE